MYWLLEKQGKLYFLQSSQTKGRDVLASKKPSLVQLPCAKTAKSCAFCDSLPVSASVCVFAFDTGGLGLWLVAFEKSGLYRCQSTPGPPMPCFVAQSFAFAVFATLICQINSVFPCKDTKAQEFGLCRILGIVMPVFCGTELRFGIEIPLIYATALCQNPRIRRSRILGLFAGFRLGMFFRQ